MKRVAIITGSSKRLGKAMAGHLASRGWDLLIHYNNSVLRASRLKSELQQRFPEGNYEIFKADLSQTDDVLKLIPVALAVFGQVDLLINNASIFQPSPIAETTEELFDNHITLNFKTPFLLIKEYARQQKKGLIINMIDTRITHNQSGYAAYSLSKKALWELTKMAALEFSPHFRVNAIAPGITLSPEDKDSDYLNELARHIPMQKPTGITPVLSSIDYIIDNNSLTGQLLFCDGGENIGRK